VVLIYFGMRRVQAAGILPAFLTAAYFAIGPGLSLSAAYFGTPFFALFVAVTWLLAQRLIFGSGSHSGLECFCFSLAGLTASLIRPEGVLISAFMLIAVAVMVPLSEFRRLVKVYVAVFLLIGGTYFAWRWRYFGYPLPNPFYKKGGGYLHRSGLRSSIWNSYYLLYPFVPAFMLSVRRRGTMRLGLAFLIPIIGSISMWVLLSDEMNFGGRFQYPTLGICALSWFPLVQSMRKDFSLPTFGMLPLRHQLILVLVVASFLIAIFKERVQRSAAISVGRDEIYDVAVMLSDYSGRGYTVATTEAGLLPLYSRWHAIDTWGLNDQWIAHHGGITDTYLDAKHPDVIMWHASPSALAPWGWSEMVATLENYALRHNYTLAAAFGQSPQLARYYYVRSDLPDGAEIVHRIRSTPPRLPWYWAPR
jgi:hypothetical protein